jgi:hypothetical protein
VAGAGDAGSATSSSELELGAEEPAPAASTAAAVAAELRRRSARRGVPSGAGEGDSAARGGAGRGGAGVVAMDWTLAQESKSARRCTWREMGASSDSRRGRCIRPRTPALPVKADRSADDMRPKMAQNLPASRGLQPWAAAALKASSARATASESFSPVLRRGREAS